MANFGIKVDLSKLRGAAVINMKGKTATKRCLIIPVDECPGIYVGQKGVYLNMIATELSAVHYGETHCIKTSLSRDEYQALDEEGRRAIPILGGMKPFETRRANEGVVEEVYPVGHQMSDGADDLPF